MPSRSHRVTWWALAFLTAVLPALVTFLLIRLRFNAAITDFIPSVWNDQTGYWHYILTFKQVGLNGGYYSLNENAPAIDLFRFDVHGPGFPVIYGLIAKVTGWNLYTSIFVNMGIIGLAQIAFVYITRLNLRQIALMSLLVLSTWPVLFYIPTSSQESLHQAGAFIVAGIFYVLLTDSTELRWWMRALCFAILLALSIVRLSWALLLVPYLMLNIRRKNLFKLMAAGLAGAILIYGILLILEATTSPGGNSILATVEEGSVADRYRRLAEGFQNNLQLFLTFGSLNHIIMQRFQFIATVVVVVVLFFWPFKKFSDLLSERQDLLFYGYNLISILGTSLAVYLVGGYYRVLAVPLLMTWLMWVASKRYTLVAAVIITNIVVAPHFLDEFDTWKPNFEFDQQQIAQYQQQVGTFMVYDDDVSNHWCNTVLVDLDIYDYRVTLIPAGIGVSWIWGPSLAGNPLQSRYLLLGERQYDRMASAGVPLNTELIRKFDFAELYYNLDSDCQITPLGPWVSAQMLSGEDSLSPDILAEYNDARQNFDIIDSERVIFNPAQSILAADRQQQITLWGRYLELMGLNDNLRNGMFQLMHLWEQVRFQDELNLSALHQDSLQAWRNDKDSAKLAAAGIEYLMYDSRWWQFTTDEDRANLSDPQQYTLVWQMQDPRDSTSYYLYEVVNSGD
jgi:hypothetical protein